MFDEERFHSQEQEQEFVDEWIDGISESGRVREIDPGLVKIVLESFGANFEISEEEKLSLGKYSNLNRRPGMNAVWGKERVDEYIAWLKNEYIPSFEDKTGRALPTLFDRKTGKFDTNKHSGMMQFFGELTAFAAGEKSFADYKRLTEDRVRKGKVWQEKELDAPYEPSSHSAFPPEFPQVAWEKIKSWK